MKLDRISQEGKFMTYTGTDKIVYFVNNDGKNEKSSTNVSYGKAHMSSNVKHLPPMAIALQQAGYCKEPYKDGASFPVNPGLQANRRSPDAAGLDIYSVEDAILP